MTNSKILFTAMLAGALGCVLRADTLTGTLVTGSLSVNGSPNYFDPANANPPGNFIPPQYLNFEGDTVTISDSAVEFGAAGDIGGDIVLITSDFLGNQLTLDLQYSIPANNLATTPPVTFEFTDAAFVNFVLAKLSDTFANGGLTPTFNGNVLTLDWAGVTLPQSSDPQTGEYTAVFSLNAVPEAGTTLLTGAGLAGLLCGAALARRKKFQRVRVS
jgi:hypothetical protein